MISLFGYLILLFSIAIYSTFSQLAATSRIAHCHIPMEPCALSTETISPEHGALFNSSIKKNDDFFDVAADLANILSVEGQFFVTWCKLMIALAK